MSQYDFLAKLLIVGNSGVGKTNVLLKFTANTFVMSHLTTIGIDFKSRTILVDGKKIRMQVWDTAGQQRFKTITQTYYKGAEGIILTYSVDDQNSFTSLQTWLKQVKQFSSENILIVIIGTKCDIPLQQRKVSIQQGQVFAKKNNLKFFQVSAKNNVNIENLFQYMARHIKQHNYDKKNVDKSMLQVNRSQISHSTLYKESQLKPTKDSRCQC